MTELLTAAQMRAIEQAAINQGTVTGLELMERAGQGVVDAIFEEWPELACKQPNTLKPLLAKRPNKAIVLCGPGNNGGDGYVIARRLVELGWEVIVYGFGDPNKLPPDALHNYLSWKAIGPWYPMTDNTARDPILCDPHPDIWIDAVFGIGLSRPLPNLVTQMFHRVYYEQNWCTAPVVSVDVPSGLNADTGDSMSPFYLSADLTVTFHAAKFGHGLRDGPDRCGKLVIKEIGL